jgi:hypothetical protein
MRVFIFAAFAVFAVACSPAAEEVDVMSEGCDARGVSQWAVGEDTFFVEATTNGPDCARAVATIVVRNASGEALYTESHVASEVMTLHGAGDPSAMQAALGEWVDGSNQPFANTGALPAWAANAEAPSNGEFPFYPTEGHTRETWAALRAHADPIFCYVQGMESMACIIYGDGGIEHLGVQTFPG